LPEGALCNFAHQFAEPTGLIFRVVHSN
jgi:hypothetical protein